MVEEKAMKGQEAGGQQEAGAQEQPRRRRGRPPGSGVERRRLKPLRQALERGGRQVGNRIQQKARKEAKKVLWARVEGRSWEEVWEWVPYVCRLLWAVGLEVVDILRVLEKDIERRRLKVAKVRTEFQAGRLLTEEEAERLWLWYRQAVYLWDYERLRGRRLTAARECLVKYRELQSWISQEHFRQARREVDERIVEIVEGIMWRLLEEAQDSSLVKFYLRARDRRYSPRLELEGEVEHRVTFENLLERLEKGDVVLDAEVLGQEEQQEQPQLPQEADLAQFIPLEAPEEAEEEAAGGPPAPAQAEEAH